MKLRTSFVSNSFSSSFIITDKNNFDKVKEILKDNCYDWYELNDTLYTSRISDCNEDAYNSVSELSSGDMDCISSWETIEIEGERGIDEIILPKDEYLNTFKSDTSVTKHVYQIVKKFMDENDVMNIICICGDKYLYDFFNELNKIIYNTSDDLE